MAYKAVELFLVDVEAVEHALSEPLVVFFHEGQRSTSGVIGGHSLDVIGLLKVTKCHDYTKVSFNVR
jgi:hypothetical protein